MSNTDQNTGNQFSDEELIKHWPGFVNRYASVNGTTLHYVEGGSGTPLICLPGWPQTWYSFRNVAPQLSAKYRVIVVDIRGMGSSDTPEAGYDKKTMASDIYELAVQLGLSNVYVMGHDIGAMVAMSLAYNYPRLVAKLIVMDALHPDEGLMQMPLMPALGTFGNKIDGNYPYAWWMGFNQVKGLPEQLLAGRFQYLLDWLFNYVMIDDRKMPAFEREVYASVYNHPDRIRAANAWYQTLTQDIEDAKTYKPLTVPVLGIGSYVIYNYLKFALPAVTSNYKLSHLPDSGHYMFEEKPEAVLETAFNYLEGREVN